MEKQQITTPKWTEVDREICKKSDEKVTKGKMTYRSIKIN